MPTPSVAMPLGSGFLGGLRGGATSIYMVVVVGSYISIGALGHDLGFPLTWTVLTTLMVWAAPAQVILIFPVAAICVEIAGLTSNGWPSIFEFVSAMPHVLVEAVKVTFVNLIYCGLITVPAAALIGLLLAGFGRMMVWMVDRARTSADGEAD